MILKQPEKQHRARYHTEGSRGAVKDRGQNSFPTLQLRGYDPKKSAVLQVSVNTVLEFHDVSFDTQKVLYDMIISNSIYI